jgi:hypothetical protein
MNNYPEISTQYEVQVYCADCDRWVRHEVFGVVLGETENTVFEVIKNLHMMRPNLPIRCVEHITKSKVILTAGPDTTPKTADAVSELRKSIDG